MKRLELLDYGRFAAVLCVLIFHYFFNGITNGKVSSITHMPSVMPFAKYGYLGVEFFFLISGYVIFFSAHNKTAGQFLASRASRLFPAFWAAALFTACFSQIWGGEKMAVNFWQFMANLTMFADILGQPFIDGVYWTLSYEWKFYFAVLMVLTCGLQSNLRALFIIWPAYLLATKITGHTELPLANGYYAYFAAGAIMALSQQRISAIGCIALALCAYLCVSFSAGKAEILTARNGVEFSQFTIAAIIMAQFTLFVLMVSKRCSTLSLSGSRLFGGITYPLYLIHAHFGYMVLSRFANNENKISVYVITIFVVMIAAYFMHELIEKRLGNLWGTLFSRTLGCLGDALQNKISFMYYRHFAPLLKSRPRE